ncbi:Phosphate transport system permease protein PstC (TC 3.A.1.7.1) [hydrothermal vent metagenome]|uniref:Phosphate transport system permease protein PstC (TC 3.A.1.7.1) n=1 Tax=hydrothermal vent metagenome TaxID=652676 RepID=A0A3B1C313_9ZZZZ
MQGNRMTLPEKASSAAPPLLLKKRFGRWHESFIKGLLFLCSAISIITTFSIMGILLGESWGFFKEVSILEFLGGSQWTPLFEPRSFGVLPLINGTLLIVVGSALFSLPIGLMSGIYLSEYASRAVRNTTKPILEILAGIPTVVYGYFALTFITPIIRKIFPDTQIFNGASASIVVGIMVLPMVISLCDNALRATPQSLRQGAYALGATSFEVTSRIVVPASLSGIVASYILAISRAIGETMAVTLAAGATPRMTLNPMESIQTMTAYIVQVSLGDTPAGTIEYKTIFAVALLLFIITLIMNILANTALKRFREVYE